MSLNGFLCSIDESSPSQALEVSGSDSLKSDKYYVTSALPDGVLQQVEVTCLRILRYREVFCRSLLSDCVVCVLSAEQRSSSFSFCSELSQSRRQEVFLPNLHGDFPRTLRHGEPQEGTLGSEDFQVSRLWLHLSLLAWGQGESFKIMLLSNICSNLQCEERLPC